MAWTAKDASEAWYGEIKDYQHAVLDDDNWYATGHYTQMVWNTTTTGAVKTPSSEIR